MGKEVREKQKPERILLICDMPPCTNYSGGIHLNQLVKILVNCGHQVYCFCVLDTELTPMVTDEINSAVDFCVTEKPKENFVNTAGEKRYRRLVKRTAQKCIQYAEKNGITKIWCPLQGEALADILKEVHGAIDVPYVLQIWDPVEWWAYVCQFSKERTEKLLAKYKKLIGGACRCITASSNMSEGYEKEFGEKKFIEVTTMLEEIRDGALKVKKDGKKFIIAMAGQAYASDGIGALLDALKKLNWKYAGKNIYFQHYGNKGTDFNFSKYDARRVRLMGNYPQAKLNQSLAKVDLLYCPYFFSDVSALKKVAESSFPSKLVTYLSVGSVPILAHAPSYSSVDAFCKKKNCAFRITSSEPSEVEQALKDILENYNRESKCMVENIVKAREGFAPDNVRRRFFWALNLEGKCAVAESAEMKKTNSFNKEFRKLLRRQRIVGMPRRTVGYGKRMGRLVLSSSVRSYERRAGRASFKKETRKKKYILELNNVDLYGAVFNGYEIQRFINKTSGDVFAQQIVNHKETKDKNAMELFNSQYVANLTHRISGVEAEVLGTKGMLSVADLALENSAYYKKADVLHFHMYHNMFLSNAFLERIPRDKKVVLDLHDTYFLTDDCDCRDCKKRRGDETPIKMLEVFDFVNENGHQLNNQRMKILNSIDADFVVHSEFMLDLFRRSPITKDLRKVHYIPFGIDSGKFVKRNDGVKLRKKYGIPKDNVVLFCRAQRVFKGTEYIEKALLAMNIKESVTVITVSETGLLDTLKNKYQIIDLGVVSDEEALVELYNLCDIFLAPSTEESFGFMAIEAMSCEKPVIIFDGTALPYTTFAPECGYVVPRGDSEGLRKAIEFLIKDKTERRRRGVLGRKLVLENYRIEDYYRRNLDLYESLMDEDSKRIEKQYENIVFDAAAKSLIRKLEKVHGMLFPKQDFASIFPDAPNYKNASLSHKIDYSSDNVQGILRRYNIAMYDILKKNRRQNLTLQVMGAVLPSRILKLFGKEKDNK
ncbi:glycosyltransferase [Candidatus Saccharibacteria bacterium]|nr:glycosyltransferase [Candidatus Saccharibacteria bacterium]